MKNVRRRWYVVMIVCTIIALFVMVTYNFMSFKENLQKNVKDIGSSTLAQNTEQLEGYLVRSMEVVSTTAVSVEFMLDNDFSSEEIEEFLLYETNRYTKEIDENFTGIYGVFDGEYIDGAGWVPDEGYDPSERDWYVGAINGNGDVTLISPYVDAQTNDIMISISKMLSDGKSVISLDIKLDNIQKITEGISVNDMGYGFVLNEQGMVVAHGDENEKGKNYLDSDSSMKDLVKKVYSEDDSYFEISLKEHKYTVFSDTIMDKWKVVMVVNDKELFEEANKMLLHNILVTGGISLLVIIFFSVAYVKTNESVKHEKESNKKVEDMNQKIIKALVRTIDAKDRYTNGHSIRVAEYSKEIAKRLNKSEKEQETVYYAGLLHDVGKIRIPVEVINKPGKLTDEEYEQIKIHPVTSYHILKDIFDDIQVKNGAKFHHERYDGKGYPNGLKGENIPEVARIIGVADTYDAMASNRSYRKALPQNVIKEEIIKGKGTQFDPEIADIMLKMIEEDKEYNMKESNSLHKTILVVDDEPMNIKMVSIILKDSPMYEVIGANSGEEALELLDNQQVDMILLDVMMPGMDGFEVISLIREKYHMPIVMMTGDRNIETIEKASKYGVDDYLTKPFLPLALKEIIHSTLN